MAIRNELTEEQITNLMQSIPRAKEVDRLRAEIERLNKDLLAQNACCDGAAAQDAHVRQERAEHKAEIEKLRADRRERIATAALQGILACQEGNTALPKEWPGIFAIMSVNCADALIAELDKEEAKP